MFRHECSQFLGMLAERELIPFLSEKERNNTDLDSLLGEKTAGKFHLKDLT